MTLRIPAIALALVLATPATGQEISVISSKSKRGGSTGQVLLLDTALDMARGFDRRTLITVDSPQNKERRRIPLLEGRRADRLAAAGDWELFRALEDRTLAKALEKAEKRGFRPVTLRRDLRNEGVDQFTFTWGEDSVTIRLVPGKRRSELFFRKGKDGPERRLARILPQTVKGSDGPMDMSADALREVALIGDGRVLLLVVGAWDAQGGRRIGWERAVLLPLKKTGRLWKLPCPLEPVDHEWRTP